MKTLITNILRIKICQRNRIVICLTLLLTGVLFVSCDDNLTESVTLSRMFRPINFTQNVDGITVDLSWTPIAGATYLLQISKDSLVFASDVLDISLPQKSSTYRLEDLWGSTRYSARIKSVSTNPAIADSEYQSITFMTQSENIFYQVEPSDIGIDYIIVKWDNTKSVDHIVVSVEEDEIKIVQLSAEDIQSGQKQISDLEQGTEYQFSIYQNERFRGSVKATTLNY